MVKGNIFGSIVLLFDRFFGAFCRISELSGNWLVGHFGIFVSALVGLFG